MELLLLLTMLSIYVYIYIYVCDIHIHILCVKLVYVDCSDSCKFPGFDFQTCVYTVLPMS